MWKYQLHFVLIDQGESACHVLKHWNIGQQVIGIEEERRQWEKNQPGYYRYEWPIQPPSTQRSRYLNSGVTKEAAENLQHSSTAEADHWTNHLNL